MVRVCFTSNLRRHVHCPDCETGSGTVRAVLEAVFSDQPRIRGYVLDDHGAVRHHMSIFINGDPIRDRARLSDFVPDGAEVYVFQALSGG